MNLVNKSNLSSSGDGADIFVIADRGAHFTNMGNLTTTGNLADVIRVSADGAVVRNLGTLTASGDGSIGIVVGDRHNAKRALRRVDCPELRPCQRCDHR